MTFPRAMLEMMLALGQLEMRSYLRPLEMTSPQGRDEKTPPLQEEVEMMSSEGQV